MNINQYGTQDCIEIKSWFIFLKFSKKPLMNDSMKLKKSKSLKFIMDHDHVEHVVMERGDLMVTCIHVYFLTIMEEKHCGVTTDLGKSIVYKWSFIWIYWMI